MSSLANRRCIPCQGGVPPLQQQEYKPLLEELNCGWKVIEGHHLKKLYTFSNFRRALEFTIAIGNLAEEENHHPDIRLSWGRVGVEIWTHKIGGLSESDFILAAKIEEIWKNQFANKAKS